jgi:hypothetical protein
VVTAAMTAQPTRTHSSLQSLQTAGPVLTSLRPASSNHNGPNASLYAASDFRAPRRATD